MTTTEPSFYEARIQYLEDQIEKLQSENHALWEYMDGLIGYLKQKDSNFRLLQDR